MHKVWINKITIFNAGVGIFAGEHPVPNNSAVLADMDGHVDPVYCSSGSHIPGIGRWLAPDGTEVTGASSSSFSIFHGGGNHPSYIALQLKTNELLKQGDEGIYRCVILDENNKTQILYTGIYLHDYFCE